MDIRIITEHRDSLTFLKVLNVDGKKSRLLLHGTYATEIGAQRTALKWLTDNLHTFG